MHDLGLLGGRELEKDAVAAVPEGDGEVGALDNALIHVGDVAPVGVRVGGVGAVEQALAEEGGDVVGVAVPLDGVGVGRVGEPRAESPADAGERLDAVGGVGEAAPVVAVEHAGGRAGAVGGEGEAVGEAAEQGDPMRARPAGVGREGAVERREGRRGGH